MKLAGAAGAVAAVGSLGTGCVRGVSGTGPAPDAAELELASIALDAAQSGGAAYADVRVSRHWNESVNTREQRVTAAGSAESYGLGIRALVGGSWGFAATRELTREAVAAAGREAATIAAANDRVAPARTELAPVRRYRRGSWVTPHEIDPFDIPIEEKADLLLRTNAAAMAVPGVRFATSRILSVREDRLVATTEGSVIQQRFIRVNPSVEVTAMGDDGDFQSRGAVVEPAGRGWEYVLGLDLPGQAPKWGEEAAEKLTARSVEPGEWDLLLHPSNLWLTIHESIAHPTELDRALGYEANYAGTSFLAPPEAHLNRTRLGPDHVTFVGNRTEAGGCATVGWDDEAVAARQWDIIRDGIFVNYQTTREQAGWIAELTGERESLGCAYGQTWADIPFQRMPNVSLMPGEEDLSLEDVIGATEKGIMIEGRGSYSIDQQRYNAQFAGQVFREIRNGKIVGMLKDVAYVMRTPDFWNTLDVLGGASTYYMGASFGDAKGQPGQSNAVSHGCPAALFRGATIINTG